MRVISRVDNQVKVTGRFPNEKRGFFGNIFRKFDQRFLLNFFSNFITKKYRRKKYSFAYVQTFGVVLFTLGFVGGATLLVYRRIAPYVFASDTTTTWDFSTAGDYTVSDSALIEVSSSTSRLKVRNYTSDANTSLLLHLDESSGNPTDSSSNANTVTNNSATFTTGNLNNAASFDSDTAYLSVADSTSTSLSQSNTLESWVKLNNSFSSTSYTQRLGIYDKGDYQLYFDNETGKLTYELADSTKTTWTQVAGNDVNSSWSQDGQNSLQASTSIGSNIYIGLGSGTSDAEVWQWNGSAWSKVGGDGLNSSWANLTFEKVQALESDGSDHVFAGLGLTAGDGEVWQYSETSGTWTKIGGDGINSGWAVNTFEYVYSLKYVGGVLYAGLGNSANDAEVWSWNGSTWTKIGGDSINSGWTTNYEIVSSLTSDGTYLYAGLALTAGDAEVWRYSIAGGTWSMIGGDAVNSSWANSTYEYVFSLTSLGGNIYAGLGVTANDAEVWRWNGTAWTQIGGDSLNSGWTTNYEGVYSLAADGTDLYAGLGVSGGDNEVWKWTVASSTWSKIGGDGVNSSFTSTTHTAVETLLYTGTTLYAGITSGNAGRSGEFWSFNGSTWTQLGGNFINSSWGYRGLQNVETMVTSGDYLYAGTGYTSTGNAQVWRYDGSSWTIVGGQGLNSSWAANTYEDVSSMVSFQGDLYVGLGLTASDAEVWKWNGSTWSQIGGDSLNSGWAAGFEYVASLATNGTSLYAGLGSSNNDSEVWEWNGTIWTKIGGDSLNSGWTTNYNYVHSMAVYQGSLIAALGSNTNEAEVWSWGGASWTKIGGDGLSSSWNTTFESVNAIVPYQGKLYAGLGNGTGDAEVWEYNGTAWTRIGGSDVNSSWTTGTYERVRTLVVYNGDLYAGIGNGAGEGEAWKYDGTSWTQVGGDSLNSGWTTNAEEVDAFSVYKGKLYAGLGLSQNADAQIWSYGGNGFLQATTASLNTSWHHVAATYDGATMKIYIDGTLDNSASASLSMPDSSRALLIGATYAGRESGKSEGFFDGLIDELRVSDTARTSFTTTPYSSSVQTVQPNTAVYTSGVQNYDAFTVSETANGGTITYRLSNDGGSTWKYYNSGWTTSASTASANSGAVINTNIATFPISSSGILWQAILSGDGTQQVTVNSVAIGAISDSTAPTNPDTLTALSASSGGSVITTNTWYPETAPYFSWSGATDAGAGVAGYYVYFGTDNTADPVTAGTFQSGATYTASSLSSGSTYYLRIKAKDNAQNTAATAWQPFIYKFDNTAPSNPSVVVVSPAGYAASNSFTFSWPSSGSGIASDSGSGVAGYQYKTGASSGSLSTFSSTTTATSVEIADAAYQTGENTFYLRTVDTAGNVSSTNVTVTYYFAGSGASAPQFLSASPSTNTLNSFAFSWTAPETYSGSVSDITYCYTVNTLPSADTCTFTSAGATSLSASSFATQTGLNIFYVAAKNGESAGGAINYGAYASTSFTANTSAPGIPLNIDVADISVKSTSTWRLTVSWSAPTDSGSGVANYQVYRSTDDVTFTKIATTTGTAYVDPDLSQITYYYKVKACDNVNNCGAYTSSIGLEPTGKYTDAAGLSAGPTVGSITTKGAVISWSTDRTSDSKVQYGTSSGSYFSSEPSNSTQITDHSITLTNLSPGTTYYYKAKWTDEDGNTGVSSEKTFTTSPAPVVTDPKVSTVGLSTVSLTYTVSGASKVKIYYGKSASFGNVTEVSTSTSETSYTTILEELDDGTKYFYKINSLDSEGAEYEGSVLTFETLPRPKISSVKIQQIVGTAQSTLLVSWTTNTEVSSIITYYPEGSSSEAKDQVNVTLKNGDHRMVLKGLKANTPYQMVVSGVDKAGNKALSDVQKFSTATDTRPPQISGMKVAGSNIKSGEQIVSQLTVSWSTDEPSTSQVEFAEGTGTTYSQKTQEDGSANVNHTVVITGLSPSKVYHLRALSKDVNNNQSNSVDTVTITPKATDDALNLVISNLQQVFGFIRR